MRSKTHTTHSRTWHYHLYPLLLTTGVVVGIPVILALLITGWPVILFTAPFVVFLLEMTGVSCLIIGIAAFFIHRHQRHQAELERYRVNTYRFTPNEQGNYEAFLDTESGGFITLPAGNTPQAVPYHFAPSITFSPSPTYSPHLSYKNEQQGQLNQPTQIPAVPSSISHPTTFEACLEQGLIGTDPTKALVGFDLTTGQPVYQGWRNIKTFLTIGDSDTGKTATVLNLAGQAVLGGARLIIIDKHKNDEESLAYQLSPLSRSFLIEPAQTDKEIERAVKFAHDRLTGRLEGREEKSFPILLLVDEMTPMMAARHAGNVFDQLILTMEEYATGGRKVICFAGGIAHLAKASRSGSEFSQACASYLVHTINNRQSRLLLSDNVREEELTLVDTSPDLNKGEILFKVPREPLAHLRVPYATMESMAMVSHIAESGVRNQVTISPAAPSSEPLLSSIETSLQAGENSPGNQIDAALEAKVAQTIPLLGHNKDVIMQQVWGERPGSSKGYKKANEEYQQVMRIISARLQGR